MIGQWLVSLPDWLLGLLALTLLVIGIFYTWLLLNWLETRKRVFEMRARLARLEQVEADTGFASVATQADVNQLYGQLAQANRALDMRQIALEDAQNQVAEQATQIQNLQALLDSVQTKLTQHTTGVGAGAGVGAGPIFGDGDPTRQSLNAQVMELQSTVARLNQTLADRNTALAANTRLIAELRGQLSATQPLPPTPPPVAAAPDVAALTAELNFVRAAIQAREANIAELKMQLGNTRTSLEMAHETIQAQAQASERNAAATVAAAEREGSRELESAKAIIAARDAQVAELETQLAEQTAVGNAANYALAERLATISELNNELDGLEMKLADRERQLSDSLNKLDAQNATIADLSSEVQAVNQSLALQISTHANAASEWEAQLREARTQMSLQATHIATLESQLRQTQADLQTTAAAEPVVAVAAPQPNVEVVSASAARPIKKKKQKVAAVATVAVVVDEGKAADDLTVITGIGPAYAKRLHKAGVRTFRQLAKMKPAQLQKTINPAKWQTLDFAGWIEQASDLAQ